MDGLTGTAELLEKQFQKYVDNLGTEDADTEMVRFERPKLSIDDARKLFNKLTGLSVDKIKEFDGFWDRNFYISSTTNQNSLHLVMKVLNATDSANLLYVEGLIHTLLHLCDKGINCPKPVKFMNGEYISHELFTASQCNFYHPGFESKRGLEMLPNYKHHLHLVEDEQQRQLVASVIESFEDRVVPNYKYLQRGIIHGDLTQHNVILQCNDKANPTNSSSSEKYRISGVIDFGDTAYSCYLFEVAIAICHFMMACPSKDRVSVGEQFKAGFESKFILNDCEKTLLDVCVTARAALVAVVSLNELKKQPGNEYVRSFLVSAWEVLSLMDSKTK
ncbi:hydroxylysine kinase-like [Glandiceps talaboti]